LAGAQRRGISSDVTDTEKIAKPSRENAELRRRVEELLKCGAPMTRDAVRVGLGRRRFV
jgi:hypothetical protein